MSAEQLLFTAVGALASCVSLLFFWAKTQFDACVLREQLCADKYDKLLAELANVERRKKPAS